MKLREILLSILLTATVAAAQTPQQNWFPQAIENLGQNASSRTEFSLDRSMLVMASKADQDDDSLRRVIAGVDGISVHRFRFHDVGRYDPQILNAVRHEYSEAGWQHIAKAHDKYGYPSGADLWVHLDHNTIRNIDVLFAGPNQVNFVAVSGSISLSTRSRTSSFPRLRCVATAVSGPPFLTCASLSRSNRASCR